MWGNLHGWLISLVLAAVILWPVWWIADLSRIAPPRGLATDPANLISLTLPLPPKDAWPLFMDDSDAGELYRKTIDAWNDDAQQAAEAFVRSPDGPAPAPMDNLIQARHCQRMTLFAGDLSAVINYDSDHPRLEKLFDAGQWAYRIGLSMHLHGRSPEDRTFLEAAFALGRQLYLERLVFDEYQKGAQLMADSSQAMCQLIPRGSELFNSLTAFQNSLSGYQDQRVIPIWQMISSVDPEVIAQSAGDVAAFARQSHERMWRVEATLKLGRYRFNAATLGDQIGAAALVRRLTYDPDPAVATAAAAAQALTVEAYRMIH